MAEKRKAETPQNPKSYRLYGFLEFIQRTGARKWALNQSEDETHYLLTLELYNILETHCEIRKRIFPSQDNITILQRAAEKAKGKNYYEFSLDYMMLYDKLSKEVELEDQLEKENYTFFWNIIKPCLNIQNDSVNLANNRDKTLQYIIQIGTIKLYRLHFSRSLSYLCVSVKLYLNSTFSVYKSETDLISLS